MKQYFFSVQIKNSLFDSNEEYTKQNKLIEAENLKEAIKQVYLHFKQKYPNYLKLYIENVYSE